MLALALMMGNLWAQADAEPAETNKPAAPATGASSKTEPSTDDKLAQEEATKSNDDEDEAIEEVARWGETDDGGNVIGDSGDQAWMMTSSALVLFMTLPGLALFYGGLVRRKNVLSVLVQCFAIACLMTILWVIFGYSLAFSGDGKFFGDFGKAWLKGVDFTVASGSMTESVWVLFQMTFAIITPALIVGAFAERMKFTAILVFMALWFTFSYTPICHMVWSGGLISTFGAGGALDYAGGTVVHINAGVAALVACIMVGPRKGHGSENMTPHNVPLVVIGAAILWVGWFGFNAGSAGAADNRAGMAALVTQIATATAAFTWMVMEWIKTGKPTAVGLATGAVAGLVAITPASGFVGPIGALIIGVAAGAVCYWASTSLKKAMGYDDSLDVFGVHCVGGIVGALLTGWLVSESMGGLGLNAAAGLDEAAVAKDGANTVGLQMKAQFFGIALTVVWSALVSVVALKIADALCGGLRVPEDTETDGLDVKDHGEEGYSL